MGSYIIVDIDGTVAKRNDRNPYDMRTVISDEPIDVIIDLVRDMYNDGAGSGIIFVTGRSYKAEKQTRAWIEEHFGWTDQYHLFMRGDDDGRADNEIKQTIWETCIKGKFDIRFVLDDRDQTVKMWREVAGLICLQVAPGNF